MRITSLVALVAFTTPAFAAGEKCPVPAGAGGPALSQGNPRARAAAQRGLDFLAREFQSWQNSHGCYGCHVQAVTLEAFSVGRHHQYKIAQADMDALVRGLLTLSGGARRPLGLSHETGAIFTPTAKAFGGAAFARYDEWVANSLRDDLIKVAGELLKYQDTSGAVRLGWTAPPVATGDLQGTYLAAQTWREVYARTADDRWLLPLSRAEQFLAQQARTWMQAPPPSIQDLNYTLMGLTAAGVGSTEASVKTLAKHVVARQNPDGGWGYTAHEPSNAFATGQTLYALRRVGLTDADAIVARGTEWLISHQAQDGGWSHAGFGKAEAMWGVMGLVSVDVLTVAVSGLSDGQHVDGAISILAQARDNHGRGVQKVSLLVDDNPVTSVCGGSLSHKWDTGKLAPGKHIIDVIAQNAKGETSRRRLEVYAGPVYLTQIGSRSSEDATVVSMRNIAPQGLKNTVEIQILTADTKQGAPKPGKPVAVLSQPGTQGAMSFRWDGTGKDGKKLPTGKYFVRVLFRDATAKTVQSEDVLFVRESEAEQKAKYAEVHGRLSLDKQGVAANAPVELVDASGNVVQVGRTTASGEYRFRNVDGGNYKVRVRKEGWAPAEAPVAAKPASEAAAPDMMLSH